MNTVGSKSGCEASTGSALLDDVAPYRDFLRGLKRDPRRIVVTGIIGPVTPFAVELRPMPGGSTPLPALTHSCSYMGPMNVEVADPGVRLKSLIDEFPDRSALTTICQRDLLAGLAQLGDLFRKAIGSPCVTAELADAKPKAEGLQVDCVVEDVIGASAIEIASCEADLAARPCWRLEADPATCTTGLNLKMVVQRDAAPDPASTTRMRCAVAP
jgi:hypothetical protein